MLLIALAGFSCGEALSAGTVELVTVPVAAGSEGAKRLEAVMDGAIGGMHHAPSIPNVRHVEPWKPFRWLRQGWDDLKSNSGASVGHGFLLAALGWLILVVCGAHINLVAVAVSGFLVGGPIAGAAFYELSRLRASGQPATFEASLDGAVKNGRALLHLGAILALLVLAWALLSELLFERTFKGHVPVLFASPYDTFLEWRYPGFFLTYMLTGAVVALVAFVLSAVAAPMIFDRRTNTKTAILTSVKAVVVNPFAMALWAILIAALTTIGFATFLLGLVIVLPVLGHATWHAYRDLVY